MTENNRRVRGADQEVGPVEFSSVPFLFSLTHSLYSVRISVFDQFIYLPNYHLS